MARRWNAGLRGAALPALLATAACGSAPPDPPGGARPEAGTHVYTCPGGYRFVARMDGDSVRITRDEGTATLARVASASGARYQAGAMTFWSRGAEALLEAPEGRWRECVGEPAETVWAVSRLLGYSFRGIGQEPGWLVEIDPDRRMHVLLDYGDTELFTGPPEVVRAGADTTIYRAGSDHGEVVVTIAAGACADIMSGEEFPASVALTIEGRRYEGCGRPLDGQGESRRTPAGRSPAAEPPLPRDRLTESGYPPRSPSTAPG